MTAPDKLGPYLAGTLAAFVVFLAFNIRSARYYRRLPPGPKALPLIGNLLDIPSSQEWLTWQAYVERYGDLVYLTALGSNYLLLGSYKSVVDLLEKRTHFNYRPRPTMLCDLMDFEWILTFVPYGLTWRRGRKIIHSQAHVHAAKAYESVQLRGGRRLVCDLLAAEATRSADKLSEAAKAILPHVVRRNFAFTAVHMIYGINVRDPTTEARYVDLPEAVLHASSEGASPGRFLVDLIPLLKYVPSWFPGANFKRFAAESAAIGRQMRDEPIAFVKAQIAAGIAPQSMAAHMLKTFPGDEELVKDIAAVIYLGGSDTVVAAVTSYFIAMVMNPRVQERVQEELDRVVGRERFPEFADKDNLPYLEAVMRECLRWLPVIPNGVAHVTGQDDEYRGYFIPKGTIVLPLHWCLLRDPETYPDPSVFSPERYLTRQGDGAWRLRQDVTDPRTYVFGFGRRVCPGKNIAEQGLFAALTTVVHTLDVMRAKDADGREVIPDVQMSSGMICHPKPFAYELRMRDDAKHLVEMCVAAVEQ